MEGRLIDRTVVVLTEYEFARIVRVLRQSQEAIEVGRDDELELSQRIGRLLHTLCPPEKPQAGSYKKARGALSNLVCK